MIRLEISRAMFCLLVCSALFASTFGRTVQKLKSVPGVDMQCKKQGYFGACFDWLPEENWITNPDKCRDLKCAQRMKTRPHVVQVLTGPALNGTICGDSKICRDGGCVKVSKEEIPVNEGSREKWLCTVVGSAVIPV